MKFNLKEEYGILKEKYPQLPIYSKINKEFELFRIKKGENLILSILRQISDYNSFFCRMIESILFPNPSNLIGAYESKSFTDEDKIKLSNMHKKLMYNERTTIMLHLKKDDKLIADYIADYWKKWEKIKKEILWLAKKMQDAWQTEDKEHKKNYFG